MPLPKFGSIRICDLHFDETDIIKVGSNTNLIAGTLPKVRYVQGVLSNSKIGIYLFYLHIACLPKADCEAIDFYILYYT